MLPRGLQTFKSGWIYKTVSLPFAEDGATVRTCLDANPTDLNQTCRILENAAKILSPNSPKAIKHCSVCDKDNCNGAGSLMASFPLAALAFVASYLLYKH